MVSWVAEDMSGWEILHFTFAGSSYKSSCDVEPSAGWLQSMLSLKLFTSIKLKAPNGMLNYGEVCYSLQNNVVLLGGLRLGQW